MTDRPSDRLTKVVIALVATALAIVIVQRLRDPTPPNRITPTFPSLGKR